MVKLSSDLVSDDSFFVNLAEHSRCLKVSEESNDDLNLSVLFIRYNL